MGANEFAPLMLALMPFTFGAKALAILLGLLMLIRQHSMYQYGQESVRFFFWLFITSVALTGMFGRLAWVFHDATSLGIWLWWMVPLEIASTMVAIHGIRMVHAERDLP